MTVQWIPSHLTTRVKQRQPSPLFLSKPSPPSSPPSTSSAVVHSSSMPLSFLLSLISMTHYYYYSQPRKASSKSSSSSKSSFLPSSSWCCSAIVVLLLLNAQVLQVTALDSLVERGGGGGGGGGAGIRRDKLAVDVNKVDRGRDTLDKKVDGIKSVGKLPLSNKDSGKMDGGQGHEKLARNPKDQTFQGGAAHKDNLLKKLEEHEEQHNVQQKEMHDRELIRHQRQQQVLDEQQKQQQQLHRGNEDRNRQNALVQDQKEREKEQKWLVDMQRKAAEKSRQKHLSNNAQLPDNVNSINSNKKAGDPLAGGSALNSQKKAMSRDINSNNNNVNVFDVKKQVADQDEMKRLGGNKASSSELKPAGGVAGVKQPVLLGFHDNNNNNNNNNLNPVTLDAVDNNEFPRLNNRRQGKINRAEDNDNFNNNNNNNNNENNAVNDNVNHLNNNVNNNNNRPYQVNENNDNVANRKMDDDNDDNSLNNARANLNHGDSYNAAINRNNNNDNGGFNNNVHVNSPPMGGININWDWEDFSIMFNNYGGAEMKVRRAPHPTTGEPWPLPQYYSKKENKVYKISKDLRFVPTGHTCDILDEAMARHLQRVLRGSVEDMYDNLQNAEGSNIDDPTLRYEKEEFVKALTISRVEIRLRKACTKYPSLESDESYDLVVKKKKTFIYANEIWGVLRGLETLGQLVWRGTDGILYIKESVISDYPRFPHRGLHIDTSRHFLFKEVLLDIMDSMEMNKLNVFHWHIVDDQSFPYESKVYPELSRKGAFHPSYVYTLEDVAELVEYARMRGIRVLPEFDTPGHTYSWGLSRPELLTQCFSGNTAVKGYLGPIDPSKNSTYRFLSTLFQEVMDVFKDQFLHLGGDEVPLGCWQSNPEVMAFANELNRKYQETMAKQPSLTQAQQQQQQQQNYNNYGGSWSMWSDEIKRVYEYYENRLIKLLGDIGRKRKNGVRYIMWQEVMNNNLQLPNDTIIQVWMGDMGDVMRATSLGYNVLYSTCWYLDHIEYGTKWPKYYHCDPVDQSYGYHIDEKKVLGGEAAFWSEYFTNENLLPMMWPRASAIAERLWSNKEVKNLEKAAARLSEHRCRMLKRGINAGEISGPGYCLHSPPKRRLFNDTIGCKGGNCSRQHNFVEIEDIQVHVSQRGGGLSECGNALSRGDTGIMILLILTFVLILFMITLTRSSSRFGRIRHCKNRSILLVFVLLLLVYFLCYTTIGLRAFEFSGSIHKTFQEDKRGQSKDGLPSLDGFQEQKRLLS